MSKKVNWKHVGEWVTGAIQSNGGKIFGGLTMIGFALLCRKLNIPISVLSDPYSVMAASTPASTQFADTTFIIAPNNSTEASIAAICDNAKTMVDSYYKNRACDQIIDILAAQHKLHKLEDSTKTFAITCIRAIAGTTVDAYYKNRMMQKIQSIANGSF